MMRTEISDFVYTFEFVVKMKSRELEAQPLSTSSIYFMPFLHRHLHLVSAIMRREIRLFYVVVRA